MIKKLISAAIFTIALTANADNDLQKEHWKEMLNNPKNLVFVCEGSTFIVEPPGGNRQWVLERRGDENTLWNAVYSDDRETYPKSKSKNVAVHFQLFKDDQPLYRGGRFFFINDKPITLAVQKIENRKFDEIAKNLFYGYERKILESMFASHTKNITCIKK